MSFDAGEWFRSNVPLVERLSRFVCRDTRLTPADVDDFVSYVMLKLIDDDYAVLRKFEGRCQMSSYVIVVVRRALSDFLAHERGKYRPSREAQRHGEIGIELDALLRRDNKTLDEAVQTLRSRGRTITRAEAERIAARLPAPATRPVAVPVDDEVLTAPGTDELLGDRIIGSRKVSVALRDAIGELSAEDQTILRLHFAAGWSVAEIARSERIDQQSLYGRLRRICKSFRKRLIDAGIDAERVNDLIGRSDVDLDFGLAAAQIQAGAPSSNMEEK